MSDVVLTGVYKFAEPHPLNSVIVVVTSRIHTQLNNCMRNNNTTTLTGNIILANTDNNQFTFAGATPTELACVHGVTSSI